MATKKDSLFFKDKQKSFLNDNSSTDNDNQQFSNLNLNQNFKCFDVSSSSLTVHSYSKSKNDNKNLDFVGFVDKNEKEELIESQKKCTKDIKILNSLNPFGEAEKDVNKQWKNNSLNATNSTLSLHIAAYENSNEAGSGTASVGKNEGLKKDGQEFGVIKKWQNSKHIFAVSVIQNPFEFPRQEDQDPQIPEISQFKSSQKLLNPNEEEFSLFANPNDLESVNTKMEKLKALCSVADDVKSNPSSNWQIATFSSYDRDHPLDQDGHPYVGLVNQAMTCYLNSLIQALFMTPEFRNILYQWQYNGTMEEASKNIPFQLQKLFALLQTTTKSSLETKDLTQSFGWEGSDAYEQHDVQELSRVMLEALEHRFRKSEQHRTFIQNLYKGTMEDFVKCLGCKRESIRQDIFNDLALAVREFGATESYKSVEEALSAFIKPELLTGSNKYKCDNCKSYQDAEKGLRFTGLPYLLVIQLKRFTVDYSSGFRVKLNDTMLFPDYLDLNNYIYDPESKPPPQKPKMSYASAATKKASSQPETILENEDFPSLIQATTLGDADGWINKPPSCDEVQTMIKKGPYVYELFAIMIHQGSATGGHYFAYIKNLEQSKWLCFNDTTVKAIDLEEVKKSFGGNGWTSNTNAYLMIYRQIDPDKNQAFTRNSELPQHVKDWLKKWEEQEKLQAYEQKKMDSMVKVRVTFNDERVLHESSPYGALEQSFPRESTGHDILRYFCNKYGEQGIFCDPESAILVPVNSSFNYDGDEPASLKQPISEMVKSIYSDLTFIMEPRIGDFSLPPKANSEDFLRTIDIFIVDVSYNFVRMCKRLCVYDQEPLESIRNRIGALIPKCNTEEYPCRMVLDSVINDDTPLRLIDDYSTTLHHLVSSRFQISRFYIDCGTPDALKEDRQIEDFTQSQMCKVIEKQKYGIKIRICLPNASDYRQAGLKPPPTNTEVQTIANVSPPPSPGGGDCGPLSKKLCQLGPLNETNVSAINTRISQPDCYYTSASSSSQMVMSSNQPHSSFVNTSLPMDRFVNSIPADSPPAYEDLFHKDPRVSPVDGIPTTPDPAASLNVFSDNDMDVDDNPGSANISPNVSDNEENRPPLYDEEWRPKWEERRPSEELKSRDFDLFSTQKDIHNEAYHDAAYCIDISDTFFNDSYQCQCINLVVDSRQYTAKLIEWLARYLRLRPENIVLLKHYGENDKGFDINLLADENIKSSFSSVARISVSLRVPTDENEKLIRVVEFDMSNDNAVDTWPTLFHVPAKASTTIAEFKEKCSTMLENAYAEKLEPNRIRIREIIYSSSHSGALILNDSKTFSSRGHIWDNLVCLQRLKPKEAAKLKEGVNYQSVIVRRFCPSTIEICPPFEVLIPENDPQGSQTLKKVVADHANLIPERIAFSKFLPSGNFARWPFTKNASELYDTTFGDLIFSPNDFAGKLIYFVDKNEQRKQLTAEDRHALKIKERVESNRNTVRRVERPLRIQMSSVSESDI